MKIAVDKKSYCVVDDKNEYIYLFDDEKYDKLPKNLHCLDYRYCDYVDINLTEFNVDCIKKAKITEKDYDKLPSKKDYMFAIIIPNYNNDRGDYDDKTYLRNCIESVLNQTYKNFKLIIVDDMSTDTSKETIKEYADKDDRVVLINNIRKRYNGGSRNVAIEYALNNFDVDYFCFLDSDDWWIDNEVLEMINRRLYNHELMTLGVKMIHPNGKSNSRLNEAKCYEDLWSLNNHLWCTAWARVIRKDKIKFFCEDTLMEDRVWTYKIADDINYDNVINSRKVAYVWNRLNTTNSVSIVRNSFWDASAYCHIGHQLQFVDSIKHTKMKEEILARIKKCKEQVNSNIYQQD